MPYYKSFNKLMSEVKKQVKKGAKDDVSRIIEKELREAVRDNIYNNYTPNAKYYQRTYQLLQSIKQHYEIVGDGCKVGAVFDNNFTHESWWGSSNLGISAGEEVEMGFIAQWLDEGKNMFRPNTNFTDKAISNLESGSDSKYIKSLQSFLRSRGIILKKRGI